MVMRADCWLCSVLVGPNARLCPIGPHVPPTPPTTQPPVHGLVEYDGSRGGYLVPPQFGDKSRPGAAYPNDVVLPVYDPNTMRPGPLPAPVNYMTELAAEKRRKRNRRRAETVAVALMMLMED